MTMGASATARVSIGIPTFNRADLLGRAIASALAQDHPEIDVIVSDNASTDATAEVCRGHAARDPRVTCVRQERNLGATRNFEAVLQHATGDYFMWLGDDDWIDPGYVSAMLRLLQADPGVALASGVPMYYVEGRPSHRGKIVSATSGYRLPRVLSYYWQVEDNGGFYGLMRTPSARRLSLPNAMGGDWIFVANLAALGKLVVVPQCVVHRELGGATASYGKIARTLGLSRLHAVFPFTSIAGAAFADILRPGGMFHSTARALRLPMATAVFLCIVLKFPFLHAKKLAVRLRDLFRPTAPLGTPHR